MSRMTTSRDLQPGASWVLHDSIWSESEVEETEVAGYAPNPSYTYTEGARGSQELARSIYEPASIPLPESPLPSAAASTVFSEPQLIMPSMRDDSSPSPPRLRSQRRSQLQGSRASSNRADDIDVKPRASTRSVKNTRSAAATREKKSPAIEASDYLHVIWQHFLLPLLRLGLGAISIVFSILKPIITILLAFGLLAYIGRYVLHSTLSHSLAPICNLPGISQLNLPFCTTSKPAGPVEFDQLMTVQSSFEDVLASSMGGANLPLDMKRSESSIRDLRQVVQYSSLPSRNELVFELSGFIETAGQAAGDLTRFNSRIGRAVDHVLSTNRWTLSVIDGIAEKEAAQGTVGRFLQNTVLAPFSDGQWDERLLVEQYLKHTSAVEDQIQQLIIEAQALLAILQNLDDRLDVINGITTRDGVNVKGSRDELFLELWTWLGGNRSNVKKHNEQLHLLGQLHVYRKTAWDHVAGTVLKLHAIAAELENLRERVAAPELLAERQDIPLRMHMEHIQMGLDRLESQRTEARRVEGQEHRRILDKGQQSGRTLQIT